MATRDQTENHRDVGPAIRKLWSADNDIRELGRKELLLIGPTATEPLVNLLSDLITDNQPRFAAEREDEGRKALKEYLDKCRSSNDPYGHVELSEAVLQLAINQRLISDAISLLGELGGAEAVRILIRIMERRNPMSAYPVGIELEALRKIGSPAVVSLIKSIENARSNATAAMFEEPIAFGVCILIDLTPGTENAEGDEEGAGGDEKETLDQEDEWGIEMQTRIIREKALRVLGDIGDESALPFLENLTKTEDHKDLAPAIFDAIRKIKKIPVSGHNPQPLKR